MKALKQKRPRSKEKWPRRFWTKKDLDCLRRLYPALLTKEVARRLDRAVAAVYGMAQRLKLKKSPEFLDGEECYRLRKGSTVGERTRFTKGHVPANKGLRRPGYSVGRMKETQFKKGCRSGMAARNWKPIGTILPDTDGYLRIKVREAQHGKEATGFGNSNVWPMYQRYLWERHNGPIPPKHLIKFKDGDRSNCVIENLYMVSMADNARANGMWAVLPRALAEAIPTAIGIHQTLQQRQSLNNRGPKVFGRHQLVIE